MNAVLCDYCGAQIRDPNKRVTITLVADGEPLVIDLHEGCAGPAARLMYDALLRSSRVTA